jgi:hemerythrin-like metal-binding protein
MLLVWTENLSVMIKELDDDNKKLIKVINELHHAILDAGASGQVEAVEIEIALHRLGNYAKVHFDREEKILAAADHADLAANREAHREMIETTAEMKVRFHDSTDLRHASELMNFTYDWLTNHVYVTDRRWALDLYGRRVAMAQPDQNAHPATPSSGIARIAEQNLDRPRTSIVG